MATIAPPPPKEKPAPTGGKVGGFDEGGFDDDGGNGPEYVPYLPERRYYTGMLMGLAAIVMFFAALTSAYIVRKGLSDDWQATALPAILWPNTLVLVASSLTLEKARRSLGDRARFQHWWWTTTTLGVTFLLGQLFAWRELLADGVYVHSNPSSSFFYLLTGTHGVHLLGGVLALLCLSWKMWRHSPMPGQTAVGVTSLYWHFMDGLWIYLFLLLLLGR